MTPNHNLPIVIVGGGMAGLTAALSLCEHGLTTHLVEASARLGGKCGANWDGKNYNEHVYHIFPLWYVNFWQLVQQLGIIPRFIDLPIYRFMQPGQFPRTIDLENIASLHYSIKNLFSGLMTPAEMFLYLYSALDIASTAFSQRVFLDHISVNGFMRSRWYATDRVAMQHQELLFKTFSVPAYQISAMSYQNLFKYWLGSPTPTIRMLRGNVQAELIEPLSRLLQEKGCIIRLNTALERIEAEKDGVSSIALRHVLNNSTISMEVGGLIVAIPPERFARLITNQLYEIAPNLGIFIIWDQIQ